MAGPGTLTNASTGFMTISGGTLNGTLNNQGTITQTGGTLTLNGSLGNVGIYNLAPTTTGTVTTGGGTFTNTSTGLLELSTNVIATLLSPFANQSGTVATTAAVNAGKLVLGGSGSSTGGTYNATTAGAFIDLAGGSTSEFTGTYSGSGSGAVGLSQPGGVIGAGSIASSGASAILDFTAESFQVTTSDGINFDLNGNTLINAGTITLTSSSNVVVYSNLNGGNRGGTFSNTGTIVQQGSGNLQLNDGVQVSNSGTYQIQADSSILSLGLGNIGSVVNSGTITKVAGTGTTAISVPFNNQDGTVDAESGTVTLSGGGTSTGGTYIANGSGVIDLTGGSSHTLTGTYIGSGTGHIKMTSGNLTIGSAGATFNFPNGLFTWTGGTFSGTLTNASTGFIPIGGVTASGTFNNLGTITQIGGTLNVVNSGSYTVTSGTVNLSGGTGGTLTESASTVNVLSGTYGGVDTLTGSGGTYTITGTLTNNGTLILSVFTPPPPATPIPPAYNLQGATIDGGTLSTTNGAELTATQAGGTLNGVTLAGTLFTGQIINTFVNIQGGLTLASAGLVSMIGNGKLNFLGSQSLTGTGTVDFADNLIVNGIQKGLYVPNSGDTLTIAAGVTVHGGTGFVGSTSGGFVTNNGTIASDGGGTITVQSDTNYASGILTGGTWEAANNSILRLIGANITTNAADIILDGVGSSIDSNTGTTNALANLTTNAATGSLTVRNGAVLIGSTLNNAGSVTVGSASNLAVNTYNQTAGNTAVAGGILGPLSPPQATALSFNGSSDYVDMGNPSNHVLDLGVNATLEAWVNFSALPVNNFATIVSKDVRPREYPQMDLRLRQQLTRYQQRPALPHQQSGAGSCDLKPRLLDSGRGPVVSLGRSREWDQLQLLHQRHSGRNGDHDHRHPPGSGKLRGWEGREQFLLERADR